MPSVLGTRGRRNPRKGIYLLPNLLTSANLFAGFFAIVGAFNGEYVQAATAILIAMVFDFLDGRVARLARAESRFGIEYDSLADLVSFGLAPGVLMYAWALDAYGRLGWAAAFLFVVCGALRLARFNVQIGRVESTHFVGLPIPGAAAVLATSVILDMHFLGLGREIRPVLMLGMTYALAFLMVSNIRYRSFKSYAMGERRPFRILVWAILILVLAAIQPQIVVFGLVLLYALSGPVEHFFGGMIRRLLRKPVPAGAPQHAADDEDDVADQEVIVRK